MNSTSRALPKHPCDASAATYHQSGTRWITFGRRGLGLACCANLTKTLGSVARTTKRGAESASRWTVAAAAGRFQPERACPSTAPEQRQSASTAAPRTRRRGASHARCWATAALAGDLHPALAGLRISEPPQSRPTALNSDEALAARLDDALGDYRSGIRADPSQHQRRHSQAAHHQ